MTIRRIWFSARVILHWMGPDEGFETMDTQMFTDDPCYPGENEDEHFIADEVKHVAMSNHWYTNLVEATEETRGSYVLAMVHGNLTFTRSSGLDGDDDDQEVDLDGPTDDWYILSDQQCDAVDEQLGIDNESTD